MTEKTFEIIKAAITLAKNEDIKSLRALKARLERMYPNNQEEREEAIKELALYVRLTRGGQ